MSETIAPLEEVKTQQSAVIQVEAAAARERIWGWFYAMVAFGWWGFVFPLMLVWMKVIASGFQKSEIMWSMEVVAHRIIWSFLVCVLLLQISGSWKLVWNVIKSPRIQGILCISSFLIACNWFGFILAAASNKLSDASLGYYINPLVNVLLGGIFLGERLRGLQWGALFFATCGVGWIIVMHGYIPWIALMLAFSFGFYGLLRKKLVVDSVVALFFESLYCVPLIAGYLIYRLNYGPELLFNNSTMVLTWLLVLSGPATAFPLLLFAAAAKRIPLSTLGFVQFITPTLQLCIALVIAGESIPQMKVVGFGLIWIGVLIYIWDAMLKMRQVKV